MIKSTIFSWFYYFIYR